MTLTLTEKVKWHLKRFLNKLFNPEKPLSEKEIIERNILKECVSLLPKLACIDVGASYYAHPAWEVFRRSPNTQWIACDPCENNLKYLENVPSSWICSFSRVPVGLSKQGGPCTLYISAVDSGSSLLPLEFLESQKHRILMDYFFPLKEEQIETITLSEVIKEQKLESIPIMIKLDTQGTELSILQGLETNILKQNLIAVEIEVNLQAISPMKGAAHFYEVQKFLEDLGFELATLKPIEMLIPKYNKKLQGKKILNECDAVFILRPDIFTAKGINYQLAILGVYFLSALW